MDVAQLIALSCKTSATELRIPRCLARVVGHPAGGDKLSTIDSTLSVCLRALVLAVSVPSLTALRGSALAAGDAFQINETV